MKIHSLIREYFWPPDRRLYLHECVLFSKKKLLALRMMLFLFSFGIYCMTNINRGSFYKNYMYLTYWGEVLTMLAFLTLLLDGILNFQGYYQDNKFEDGALSRAAHILFEIAFSYEFAIVIMYWLAVFPTATDEKTSFFYTTNILVHGICFVLLWIENIVNFIEFFPRHFIIVTFVAIAYVIDNIIVVFFINFDTVYTVLKWTDVASYLFAIGCWLVAILHFFLGWLIFRKIKFKKWGELIKKNYEFTPQSPSFLEMERKPSLPK